MMQIPVIPGIDEKNAVFDGREYAMQCMIVAYRVIGAYADGDADKYEALKKATEYLAQLELHQNDEDVPDGKNEIFQLMRSESEAPGRTPQERWQSHLTDTAEKTRSLLDVAAAI